MGGLGVSSWVGKSRIIGMEMSNSRLAHKVDYHDDKLSGLEATVLDMYAFMKCQLGKGKGKEKVVEEEDEDAVVDDNASSPIHTDSVPYDDTFAIVTPVERPMSTFGWLSVHLLNIYYGLPIARVLRDPNFRPGMPVHGRPLQDIESRVRVTHVVEGKENSPVWLCEQCGVQHIGGV